MMKNLTVLLLVINAWFLFGLKCVNAQTTTGTIQGTVADPSGALIPQAAVTITNGNGFSRMLKSSASGAFTADKLVPGRYSVQVSAKGFTAVAVGDVLVYGAKTTNKNVTLEVSADVQVEVTANETAVSTSPDDNASAMVIKGKDLDALSDDPDELQNELTALAGPAAGPSGAQIYIDGFTGGQLPPKSSIREIRINRNPFSAQFDKLGYGRIEILTKPGTDKLHGMLMVSGNDNVFNSLNPFVTSEPAYHSTFMMGNASGSMSKTSSWFTSVFRRDNASNSIVNALKYSATDPNGQAYKTSFANPQSRLDISPRFDFQLGSKNTLSVRYMFDRQKDSNDGVSGLSLPSQAYDVSNYEHTIQISDTQILSAKVVNETRFQYTATRNLQTALVTTPTIVVSGAFTDGGNSSGTTKDNQDRYELQNYVTAAEGRHALNFGTRLRLTHEVNSSTAGTNGTFLYTSLAAYAAHTPSQYSVTVGSPTTRVNLFDASFFFQDDWTVKPNFTFSYGVRYEGQNRISDHNDWAPRFAVAWAPGQHDGKKASTVFRAGYGWFYDRFAAGNVLSAIRQNGVNQQQYVVKNAPFNENTTPKPTAAYLASLGTTAPTLVTVAPNLRSAVNMQAAFGVDRSFGKYVTVSGTYINSRGVHQYYSDNINAYIPSTYNATTGTGIRPNGINENINQYQSGGVYNQNQLMFNYSVRAKRVSLFGFYTLNFAKSDAAGAGYFPSDQTNPGKDYGRATFDVRNRFLIGGNYQAPFGISLSPFLVANAGSPFNVTIGQDTNGDNQYNDRPSYATATSTNTMQTAFGNFDLSPSANAARVPYNLGTGPAQFSMDLRVSKSFGIGPKVEGNAGGGASGGGPGGPGGGGGPRGGGGGGGGLGPGGLSGGGGPPRLDQTVARRYSLTFSAMGHNVLNHVSLAAPNGVLSSPLFGKSTAISGGFFGSAASNRSIDLQATFSF